MVDDEDDDDDAAGAACGRCWSGMLSVTVR